MKKIRPVEPEVILLIQNVQQKSIAYSKAFACFGVLKLRQKPINKGKRNVT